MLVNFRNAKIAEMVKKPTICGEEGLDKVRDGLKLKGFTCLGSGSFGEVWGQRGKQVVVKLFNTDENDAYLDFLKEVQKANGNPYLPNVYLFGSFKAKIEDGYEGESDDYCDCRQCKASRKNRAKPAAERKKRYRDENYCVVVMERLANYHYKHSSVPTVVYNAITNLAEGEMDVDGIKVIATIKPEVEQLVKSLRRLLNNHESDFHDGNVMMRGKQLVFTDPVC